MQHNELIDDFTEALNLIQELVQTTELNMDNLELETKELLLRVAEFQNRILANHVDKDDCTYCSCECCACQD